MSCNYADSLSPYENKGVLGLAERFDSPDELGSKVTQLVEWWQEAKHVVIHTGAGISTAAGIPDFRGPNGVWTLEQKGEKPHMDISFDEAIPTTTHMALRALVDRDRVHYVISQNIDGLHLKSGLGREKLAELHGNMFVEQCNKCRRQYVRRMASNTVGQKPNGGVCCWRRCRSGKLLDNVLDWEHDLPERDLEMATMHSTIADLNITLGTTLQINPSGNLPLKNRKLGGKLIICNLQPTKHDKKADLLINGYTDAIMEEVCRCLEVNIPTYVASEDPTKWTMDNTSPIVPASSSSSSDHHQEWSIPFEWLKDLEKLYQSRLKANPSSKRAKVPVEEDSLGNT